MIKEILQQGFVLKEKGFYKRAMEELDYDFFEARLLKSIILYDSGYLAIAKKELDKLVQEQPENDLIIDYRKRIDEELKI